MSRLPFTSNLVSFERVSAPGQHRRRLDDFGSAGFGVSFVLSLRMVDDYPVYGTGRINPTSATSASVDGIDESAVLTSPLCSGGNV